MKRIMICLAILGMALGLTTQAKAANILMVNGNRGADEATVLGSDDGPMLQSLLDLGHTVTQAQMTELTAAAAAGQDLIIVSESISGGDGTVLNAEIGDLDIPIILCEPAVIGAMEWSDGGGGAGGAVTAINVIDNSSEIADGLPLGNLTIFNVNVTALWANTVMDDMIVIAEDAAPLTAPGPEIRAAQQPSFFYYEPGATMFNDRVAVNFRGFFPVDRGSWAEINANGEDLLERMLNVFLTPPPPPTTTIPFSGVSASDDAFVSNDDNNNNRDASFGGEAIHARFFSNGTGTVRLRVGYLRFDLNDVNPSYVPGTFTDIELTLGRRSNDGNGEFNIYGILEEFDLEAPGDTSFNTGAGINQAAAPSINDAVVLDFSELTTPTLIQLPASGGVAATSSTALTQFINDDTDGIVTFLIAPAGDFDINVANDVGGLIVSIEGGNDERESRIEWFGDYPVLAGNVEATSVNRARNWTMFE